MGIKNLAKTLKEKCKKGIMQRQLKYYTGHKVAIDASMCIYQFLVSVRAEGSSLSWGDSTTSHLNGLFYRSIRWIEQGITPVFIFDGKAPAAKVHELSKREKRREEVTEKLEHAKAADDKEAIVKYEKMNQKMEKWHIEECQKLLHLLNIPYITAPSEAEAYASWLCKMKYVDAVATEDMDTLTFGSPVLLRNFNASQSKKLPIEEYNLECILKELNFTMDQFIDMCILFGCDYSKTLPGIGQKGAYNLIEKHKNIKEILEVKEFSEEDLAEFKYKEASEIFKELTSNSINDKILEDKEIKTNVESVECIKLKCDELNEEGVIEFLCDEKGFDKNRIQNGIAKLKAIKGRKKQTRIENFFKVKK